MCYVAGLACASCISIQAFMMSQEMSVQVCRAKAVHLIDAAETFIHFSSEIQMIFQTLDLMVHCKPCQLWLLDVL